MPIFLSFDDFNILFLILFIFLLSFVFLLFFLSSISSSSFCSFFFHSFSPRFKDFDGDDERAAAFPLFKRNKMIRIKAELEAAAAALKAAKV